MTHNGGDPEDETGDGSDESVRETNVTIDIGLRPVTDLLGGLLGIGGGTPDTDASNHEGVGPGESADGTDESSARRDYHVEVYRDDETVTVAADLPGVEEESLTMGLDERTGDLVIGVDDAIVERVSLPWRPVLATEATFNNGVLTVVLREDDATG